MEKLSTTQCTVNHSATWNPIKQIHLYSEKVQATSSQGFQDTNIFLSRKLAMYKVLLHVMTKATWEKNGGVQPVLRLLSLRKEAALRIVLSSYEWLCFFVKKI